MAPERHLKTPLNFKCNQFKQSLTQKRMLYTKRAGTRPINIIVTFNTAAQTHTHTEPLQRTNESRLCASSTIPCG